VSYCNHIVQSSTDDLMDYTVGTGLVKHQRDAIHDPGIVIGMFEWDEEGAILPVQQITTDPQVPSNKDLQVQFRLLLPLSAQDFLLSFPEQY